MMIVPTINDEQAILDYWFQASVIDQQYEYGNDTQQSWDAETERDEADIQD